MSGIWEKKGCKGVISKETPDSIPSSMLLAETGSLIPAESISPPEARPGL